jgi:hypothetical protein
LRSLGHEKALQQHEDKPQVENPEDPLGEAAAQTQHEADAALA